MQVLRYHFYNLKKKTPTHPQNKIKTKIELEACLLSKKLLEIHTAN